MKITVGKKLTAIFVIILLLMLFAAFVSAHQLKVSAETLNVITEERQLIINALDLQAALVEKNHSLLDMLMFGQNEQLFDRALQEYETSKEYIETLLQNITSDLTELGLAIKFGETISEFQETYLSEDEHFTRLINTYRVGGKNAAKNMIQDARSKEILETMIEELKESNKESYQTALQKYRTGITIAIVIFIIAVFLAITIATRVGKRLISDIFYLTSSADEISLGSLETPIALDSNDELGELAEVFERLRLDIKKAMNKIHQK